MLLLQLLILHMEGGELFAESLNSLLEVGCLIELSRSRCFLALAAYLVVKVAHLVAAVV